MILMYLFIVIATYILQFSQLAQYTLGKCRNSGINHPKQSKDMIMKANSEEPCDKRRPLDFERGDHKSAGNNLGIALLSDWTLLLLAVVKYQSVTLITS